MQVNVEKLSPVLLEFQIEVPADKVSNEVNAAYEQLKRTARVKGFRRGKAPRKVLAQLYGPAIRADVAQRLVDQTLQEALDAREVQPLTKPSVEPAELKTKQAFSFRARFEVRPEIEGVAWTGLEAARPSVEVTSEEVDQEIEKLRLEHSTLEPVEGRAAEEGDTATLRLAFEALGAPQSEELDTEVGGGQLLPFIDEGVVGMKVDDEKTVNGPFPENHPNEQLRGVDTSFHITLKELKKRVLPDVDDELAKDLEYDDLAAMKSALEKQIADRHRQKAEEDVARQLVANLCDKNPIPVPPSLVRQQQEVAERELRMVAQMTGQRPDDPELVARMRADAETKVRAGLLMAEIAKEKDIKITDEDLEKGYEELAAQTGKNVARLRVEYRDKQKRDLLVGMILEDKVLNLMEEAATITEA
ncbi:MAG: trigger factor [Myxococcota bacterium]